MRARARVRVCLPYVTRRIGSALSHIISFVRIRLLAGIPSNKTAETMTAAAAAVTRGNHCSISHCHKVDAAVRVAVAAVAAVVAKSPTLTEFDNLLAACEKVRARL